jgi:hypothetical protein
MDGTATQHDVAALRRHRAELLDSLRAVEQALAAPAVGDVAVWAQRVSVALIELEADVREHVQLTEGADGLYRSVLEAAPRLSNVVRTLTADHGRIRTGIAQLVETTTGPVVAADVARIRHAGTALLARMSRHRQRGADLVFEAYQTDIGGET